MPLHSELARIPLFWSHRLPGIRLLLAKKNVADAFKWLWLLAECAGLFSCEFEPGDAGLESGLICLWLSLNFGWKGGPGSFVEFGTLIRFLHSNFAPENPAWNDTVPFRSLMLMDDLIIVEPGIGFRAYMSLGLAEAIFLKLLGPSAMNLIKDLLEGSLDSTRIIWGLIYYTDRLV